MATMRSSILREFTKKNPILRKVGLSKQSTNIAPSKKANAHLAIAPIVIRSELMRDFEADVLLRRHPEITNEWQPPPCVTYGIPNWQTEFNNEETFEHQVFVPVIQIPSNAGLVKLGDDKTRNRGNDYDLRNKLAKMVEKTDLKPDPLGIHIGRGSKSQFRTIGPNYRSDWGLYSTLYNRNTHENSDEITECFNLLPADSKTSESFKSEGLADTSMPTNSYWDPVRQVIRYAKFAGPSRRDFTWINTDEELTVIKIQYHDKDTTSSAVDPPQLSQEQQPTSTDVGPVQPDTCSIQYKVIKWEAYWTDAHWASWNERKIPGPMTQRLGVMWLCWKAAFGDDDDLDDPPSGGTRSRSLAIRTGGTGNT